MRKDYKQYKEEAKSKIDNLISIVSPLMGDRGIDLLKSLLLGEYMDSYHEGWRAGFEDCSETHKRFRDKSKSILSENN